MKQIKEIRLKDGYWVSELVGFGEEPISNYSLPEEVITIKAVFFKKPYYKQRAVLKLVIWWAVKHYFKILFKK